MPILPAAHYISCPLQPHLLYILCRVCKFQDDRRHHDKCRSHPCWRGAACSAPGKPQPRERQPEEAAKNLSKSPSSESEVLQVELNLAARPQVPFPDIIQFIARQWQKIIKILKRYIFLVQVSLSNLKFCRFVFLG